MAQVVACKCYILYSMPGRAPTSGRGCIFVWSCSKMDGVQSDLVSRILSFSTPPLYHINPFSSEVSRLHKRISDPPAIDWGQANKQCPVLVTTLLVPIPSALMVMLPTRIGRWFGAFWGIPRQSQAAARRPCHAHSCVRRCGWSAGGFRRRPWGGSPCLLAHGKSPVLVHDPAGMGSWVRLRRAGERLGADVASSTQAVVLLETDKEASRMAFVGLAAGPYWLEIRRRRWPAKRVRQWVRCLKCSI